MSENSDAPGGQRSTDASAGPKYLEVPAGQRSVEVQLQEEWNSMMRGTGTRPIYKHTLVAYR